MSTCCFACRWPDSEHHRLVGQQPGKCEVRGRRRRRAALQRTVLWPSPGPYRLHPQPLRHRLPQTEGKTQSSDLYTNVQFTFVHRYDYGQLTTISKTHSCLLPVVLVIHLDGFGVSCKVFEDIGRRDVSLLSRIKACSSQSTRKNTSTAMLHFRNYNQVTQNHPQTSLQAVSCRNYVLSAKLFHYTQEKADIFPANISKTWQLTPKQSRWTHG